MLRFDRELRQAYSHEALARVGQLSGADERFGLDVSAPKLRRVNLIER